MQQSGKLELEICTYTEGVSTVRISRSTGALSGLLLVLLGIWGGIIPFIGPYFGYAFGSHATWDYTANRLWLDILPGAAVLVGGLILLQSGHRLSGMVGSWLAMAGGAWFAVGPAVSRLWEHGSAGPIGAPLFGTTRQMLELIGYFYGLGIVTVGLAAFALGRFVSRPALVVEPASADTEPVRAGSEPATQPVSSEPVTATRRPITGGTSPDSTAPSRERVPTR